MKSPVFMCAAISMSFAANASEIGKSCYARAEKATERFAEPGYYDHDGFTAYNCESAPNGAAVLCEVSASKGKGAATDTFRVVLSRDCSRTYRVELIGEE